MGLPCGVLGVEEMAGVGRGGGYVVSCRGLPRGGSEVDREMGW